MKIIRVIQLPIPEIKVIRFFRYHDERGYFVETFRESDFANHPDLDFMRKTTFKQSNESFSRKGTIRGLHFQWNPPMAKLVRTIEGKMVDIVLDIRKNSPTFGKIIAYEMPYKEENDYSEWIWVPPGFAHGNFYLEDSRIEYFCTTEYNPAGEASISPFSPDIDWLMCDKNLKNEFDQIKKNLLITDKDKNGFTLTQWLKNERSNYFVCD